LSLKLDKFSLSVIVAVVVLLVAAVVTVNVTGGQGWGQPEYLDEETPAAAVHNAYAAFIRQQPEEARRYYTQQVLESVDQGKGVAGPFSRSRYPSNQSQRLRILDVQFLDNTHATVTFAVDHYVGGGLFDAGSSWTYRNSVPVLQVDGHWQINAEEFFY
jgi:hypothetical protein